MMNWSRANADFCFKNPEVFLEIQICKFSFIPNSKFKFRLMAKKLKILTGTQMAEISQTHAQIKATKEQVLDDDMM